MSKFKVGDEVEFIVDYYEQFKKGYRFIVTDVDSKFVYGYGTTAQGCYPERLKLVTKEKKKKKIKYPVGTIVQLVPEELPEVHGGGWTEEPLKVVQYDKGSDTPYVVAWTTPDSHSGIRVGMVLTRQFSVKQLRKYQEPVKDKPSECKIKELPQVDRVKEAEERFQRTMDAHIQMQQDALRFAFIQRPMIIKPIKKEKKENIMTTIREKIRYAALSKDEKLLRENDILSDSGNLTDVGRRVVLDILFEDKELRKRVVTAVESTIDKK